MLQANAHASRRHRLGSVRLLVAGLCFACLPWVVTECLHASELTRVATSPLPGPPTSALHTRLASHHGQPVLINFWASWCEPCRQEMPSLQRLASRWRERGLVVITVAVADNRQRVETFLAENALQLTVVDDREQLISRACGARVLPSTLVLDRRHRIRWRAQGAIDWDSPAIDQTLQPLFK